MKRMAIVVLLAWLATQALSPASPRAEEDRRFRFMADPGSYSVGLQVIELSDRARTFRHAIDETGKPFDGERGRPLQILMWYPSTKSAVGPMKVADYLDLWGRQTTFASPRLPMLAKDWRAGMRSTLSMPLLSVRDAPPMPGRFPVLIYAASFSRPSWENADLCEYLASHGYLVLGLPSMGVMTRTMTTDVAGANAQARDISFAITHASTLPNADVSAVSVVGYSWGGLSNIFAAARDSRIDALVALDGSVRYFPDLVQQAGDVHPERMTIPLLYFAQGEVSIEDAERLASKALSARSALNAWVHGDLLLVRMLGLTHQGFSAMSQRNEFDWSDIFPVWKKADFGRADAMEGYAWVARYTLWFVDAYLKHDSAAMERLKKTPVENSVPKHFMSASFRSARGLPPSMDGFRAETGRRGLGRAAEVYAEFRDRSSEFALDQVALLAWADELLAQGQFANAVSLLELNVQIRPESSAGFAALGDAYADHDDRTPAIDSYRRALALDPKNAVVAGKLSRAAKGQ